MAAATVSRCGAARLPGSPATCCSRLTGGSGITRRWSGPRRRYTSLAVARRACAAAAAQRHYVMQQEQSSNSIPLGYASPLVRRADWVPVYVAVALGLLALLGAISQFVDAPVGSPAYQRSAFWVPRLLVGMLVCFAFASGYAIAVWRSRPAA